MRKTQDAIDFLDQLRKLDLMIQNKLVEKEQWMNIASGVSAQVIGERVQSTPNLHKMETAVCRYVEIENEINRRIDELIDKRMEVLEVIEKLPATEYDLIHKKYVSYIELDEIAMIAGKSYSWATSTHGRALAKVQQILNDRKEQTNGGN